jgi:hypothetical protein
MNNVVPRIGQKVVTKERCRKPPGRDQIEMPPTAAWRAHGTDGLADLFTGQATYLQSPCEQAVTGLDAIRQMWDAEREGPDEVFSLDTDILAVDGPVAVVRAEVRYGEPPRQEYRDLWVIRLDDDGRCSWFEEWPYWPGRPFSARDDQPYPVSPAYGSAGACAVE